MVSAIFVFIGSIFLTDSILHRLAINNTEIMAGG